MAYSRITGTRNGADAIGYGRGKGKGHNNKKVRNMVISEVNMLPETVLSYEKQMQKYWDRASAKIRIRCGVSSSRFQNGS